MNKTREINLLSVVVSVFNEEDVLEQFWTQLSAEIKKLTVPGEVIFVDDGSIDNTPQVLNKIAESGMVRVITFSRNFGHEAAMLAGIDHAKGDAIICLDADGQHPPEKIPEMLTAYQNGNDIVNMVRDSRADHSFRGRLSSRLFYKLLNKISPVNFHENASDFFLISGRVAKILRKEYRERTRFIRGFIQIIGFEKTTLKFDSDVRKGGESKYSFSKLLMLSVSAIVSFSKVPLHLGLVAGIIFSLFAVFVGVYSIVQWLVEDVPPGYTTLVVFVALSFAMVFFLIGILGVYIGFMFEESKKRPIYIIDEIKDDNED